jgi:hypothetical protein
MTINQLQLIQHPHITKIIALILGYCAWFAIAQYENIQATYQVPIYFYDTQNQVKSSHTSVTLIVSGKRSIVHELDSNPPSIHIDASSFTAGQHEINLNSQNLFLPDNIKLVNLIPSHISIIFNPIEHTNNHE